MGLGTETDQEKIINNGEARMEWSKPALIHLETQYTEGKANFTSETAGAVFGPS